VQRGSAGTAKAASGASFSRPASGLIRVAGSWDVFLYNVGLVSVGIAVAFNQYFGPSLYPGAMVWLSTLLATLGMIAAAGTFYFWSVIFPRSGGVYVSLSRSTTASLAFVFSVVESVILLYYGALAASLAVKVGIAPFFSTIGRIGGSSTLLDWASSVSTKTGVFCVGTGLLLVAGLLLTSGTRRYFTSQKILFAIAGVGTLVVLLVLVFGTHASFVHNFHTLTGLSVGSVIATAKAHGFKTAPHTFWETVKMLVWPLVPLLGAMQSVALGGEIKKVNRNQLVGMLGAVIATGLVICLFSPVADHVFGSTFQGAIGFNSIQGLVGSSTESSMGGAAPYLPVLTGILTNSVFLSAIVPSPLGYVSKRFNTPVVAIWISTALSIVFMWAIAYKSVNLLTLIEPLLIVWGTAMAVAIVFPFTGRRFFRASAASAYRIGRVPLMSITGALAVAFFVLSFVLLWNDTNAAGPLIGGHISTDLWIVIITVAVSVLWYAGNKLYRLRKGVDVSLAFKQIPIE
jgi:amino acid transporter